jgi:L-lactate dehydrogenase complex protein LldG
VNTDERTAMFDRIHRALAPIGERTPLPDFTDEFVLRRDHDQNIDAWPAFSERFRSGHGITFEDGADLAAWLHGRGWARGYCDPALWPLLRPFFGDGFAVETKFDRRRVDDYQFGITRAQGAIAETGTLILRDAGGSPRLAALTPWVHIAAVRREDILPNLPSAVAALRDDPNIIWVSGPSKTGDIESVLVEGVHGPGVQAALLLG